LVSALSVLVTACAAFGVRETVYYARTDDLSLTEQYGTKQLTVSGSEAFDAVLAGLRAEGFAVAIANRDRGLIRTAPKAVSVYVRSSGAAEARFVERAYVIVAALGRKDERVKVVLGIRHYRNGMDVTESEFVRVDILKKQWHQLYDAIYSALPSRAVPATRGDTTVL